jgi:hypothetical protein
MKIEDEIINLQKNMLSKLIGKTVYFMIDKYVTKGKIKSYDNYQLFVDDKYKIGFQTNFFFSEKELFEFLSANIRTS